MSQKVEKEHERDGAACCPLPAARCPTARSGQRPLHLIQEGWSAYNRGLGWLVSRAAAGAGWIGTNVSQRPVLWLLMSLVVSLASCAGWARFRLESDPDVLWMPQSGRAQDDSDYVNQVAGFPQSQAGASFFAQLRPELYTQFGGNNALQIPVTHEMFKLYNAVLDIKVKNGSKTVSFLDICDPDINGRCGQGGYLWFWYNSYDRFLLDVNGSPSDPTTGNKTAFKHTVSQLTFPDGKGVSMLSIFGGTEFVFSPMFSLQSAEVIAVSFSLRDTDDVSAQLAEEWNKAFTDLMKEMERTLQYTKVAWITGSSVGEEIEASVNGDMGLVIISLALYVAMSVLLLSKLHSVATRTTLALGGVFVTLLGIVVGWAWGMIFGMPFTVLQQLSPFILLGMGIDVVFVMVKSYDILMARQPSMTLPEAFSKLMSTAGLSVQVTLLASTVAFAMGVASELSSVKWFSGFAALNTICIMVLMITLFLAMFVLTEKRIAAGRRDLCCCTPCMPKPLPPPATQAAPDAVSASPSPGSGSSSASHCAEQASHKALPGNASMTAPKPADAPKAFPAATNVAKPPHEHMVKRVFRTVIAPTLAHPVAKAVVILVFAGYAAACFVGIYQLQYGQPLSELATDGSYLQDYSDMAESTYEQQVGAMSDMYFRGLDFSSPVQQGKQLRALGAVLDNKFVNASTTAFLSNWLVSFIRWSAEQPGVVMTQEGGCANPLVGRVEGELADVVQRNGALDPLPGCVPQSQFYPLLDQFLRTSSNKGFQQDVLRNAANTSIHCARMPIMHTAKASDDKYPSKLLHEIYDTVDSLNSDPSMFAAEGATYGQDVLIIWNSDYAAYEGDAILPGMALEYFILALVGVGIVVLLLLVNPLAALYIMCAVGLVDLFLLGECWILGIRFNQVSVINMIMSTGLAVDYSVYFAQKFMVVTADGTRNGRMKLALSDTGSAVFLGGITALVGTVPMAFASSVIIRTFFSLMFGTILFSLLVGLVLMPVVFSLVGPPPVHSALIDGDNGAGNDTEPHADGKGSTTAGDLETGKAGPEGLAATITPGAAARGSSASRLSDASSDHVVLSVGVPGRGAGAVPAVTSEPQAGPKAVAASAAAGNGQGATGAGPAALKGYAAQSDSLGSSEGGGSHGGQAQVGAGVPE